MLICAYIKHFNQKSEYLYINIHKRSNFTEVHLHNDLVPFDFDISTLFQLFDAFVGSILNFSSEIWGMSKSKEIEHLHLKFCKKILGVESSTCTSILYSELNRYPLYINRYSSIIKYWGKILSFNNLIISTMYNALLAQSDRGASNWCSNVKSFIPVWFCIRMV